MSPADRTLNAALLVAICGAGMWFFASRRAYSAQGDMVPGVAQAPGAQADLLHREPLQPAPDPNAYISTDSLTESGFGHVSNATSASLPAPAFKLQNAGPEPVPPSASKSPVWGQQTASDQSGTDQLEQGLLVLALSQQNAQPEYPNASPRFIGSADALGPWGMSDQQVMDSSMGAMSPDLQMQFAQGWGTLSPDEQQE